MLLFKNVKDKRMESSFDLRTYLMSDFSNNKHKKISLIELYSSDNKYYSTLVQKHLIEDEAMKFFQEKGDEVREAKNIPTEGFRKLRYELIILNYLRGRDNHDNHEKDALERHNVDRQVENKSNSGSDTDKQGDKSKGKKQLPVKAVPRGPLLHCVDDKCVLKRIDVKNVKIIKTGKTVQFPRYECPACNRRYTLLTGYKDLQPINLDGIKYTNITLKREDERYIKYLQTPHRVAPGTKCYIYGTPKTTECRVCGSKALLGSFIEVISKKGKRSVYNAKVCSVCKTYYLAFNIYKAHEDEWLPLNEEDIPVIKENLRIRAEQKAKRKAERKAEQQAQALKKQEERLRKKQEEEKRKQERLNKARITQENSKIAPPPTKLQKSVQIHEHDNNIRVKDFVVRRTTFKCRHNDHRLQNIDAVINIINKDGDIKQTTVSAGYCPNCNLFFIMESTYQKLKLKGTPICRVSDEKTYLSGSSFVNGMRLAQESVLMQYGYTVSQAEGLTGARRRKILALLIDNKILTRSDIISYLDFFINQRKNQHRFEKAIEKWESDREFVSEYRAGSYLQYGVAGIHRKH